MPPMPSTPSGIRAPPVAISTISHGTISAVPQIAVAVARTTASGASGSAASRRSSTVYSE